MITAVDTNVLLDLLIPDAPDGETSERALTDAAASGAILVSEAVYAELSAHFPRRENLDRFLAETGIRLDHSGEEALHRAGRAWSKYTSRRETRMTCPECSSMQAVQCNACGKTIGKRQHVLADFLIAGHAAEQADCLLTRDRGYYKTYFAGLELL